MPVKRYQPNHHGRRNTSVDSFSDITRSEPLRSLIVLRKAKSGRSGGTIVVRHQGGGHRRYIRLIDSRREKYEIPAKVASIEYDPNRNARIALLHYRDGEKRYIVAPEGLMVGTEIVSSKKGAEIITGNRMPLKVIPVGVFVYDVELAPGKGGQIAKSAGSQIQVTALERGFAQLKMPSSEVRLVSEDCMATIGQASNVDAWLVRWGKAGRTRHRGIRPTVRGKVMNPVDHPHGGGEGKHPIGLKHPKTPQGKPALGVKTRNTSLASQKLILKRRAKKRRI
ncbi:MAG: 50S ribosomal protein L2 [bacterium]